VTVSVTPRGIPDQIFLDDPALDWLIRPIGDPCEGYRTEWDCDGGVGVGKAHDPVTVAVPVHCHERSCPRCNDSWAARRAVEATARLAKFAATRSRGRFYHVVIAPPREVTPPTLEGLHGLFLASREALRAHGSMGEIIIAHYEMKGTPGEWRPHIHALAWVDGRFVPGPVMDGLEGEGWLIKFITISEGVVMTPQGLEILERGERHKAWDRVRGLLRYELDHCIRPEGTHAYRYSGDLSYSKLRNPTKGELEGLEDITGLELLKRKPSCPLCGRELVQSEWLRYGTRESLMESCSKPVVFLDDFDPRDRGPPEGVFDEL